MVPAVFPLFFAWGCGWSLTSAEVGQSWELDRLRLLAARAEPAEAQPGDDVSFEALVFVPSNETLRVLYWAACPDPMSCEIDDTLEEELQTVDPATLDETGQAELLADAARGGVFAVEPLSAPTWTVPADVLDDQPEGTLGAEVTLRLGAVTEDDVDIALRGFVISLNPAPNQNPTIEGFTVDGVDLDDGATLEAEAGVAYEILPRLGALETYVDYDEDGAPVEMVEQPCVDWYTQVGTPEPPVTAAEDEGITWTAPDTSGEGVLVAVVRDRRGGMGWAMLDMVVSAR